MYLDNMDSYFICDIIISKAYREKGTLKKLYNHFLSTINVCKPIRGRINKNNIHSKDVHEHIGFKLIDEDKNLYEISYEDFKKWCNK